MLCRRLYSLTLALLLAHSLSAQTLEATGHKGLYADPLYPDQIQLKIGEQVHTFQASTGVEPAGLRPFANFTIHPDQRQNFEELTAGREIRFFIQPANQPPPQVILTKQQKYNFYQILLRQSGHQLGQLPCVIGLRGRRPDGTTHSVRDNYGGYNDTFVVLREQGRYEEYLGCTHASDPQDSDAPASGVAQIRPGHYRAKSIGYHHGYPCWQVYTRKGESLIPCARDQDRNGTISDQENSKFARASHILFHHGLYADRPSSIGCLTLGPDCYPTFAASLHPKPFDFHLIEAESLPPTPLESSFPIGKTYKGKPLEVIQLGQGPRVALLFATIHGDEPAGTELLQRLRGYLQDQPELLERWQVRLILCLNRDSQRRTNLRGVDLNRNFPSFWQRSSPGAEYSGPRPLSEPESLALQRAVLGQWPAPVGRPERILSFHQHRGIPSGSAWLDADGPAADLVRSMQAQAQGRLSIHKVADSQGRLRIPGSFGTWAQHLNIPTVTFELSSQDQDGQANWDNYHQAILEFLRCP